MKLHTNWAVAALALPSALTPIGAALALTNTAEEPVVLEKVVVSDKKPLALTVNQSELSEADITAKQAQVSDTAKLLEDVPGVSLQGAGGVSALPILHGLNDDRVKIDVNGMTITSACANHMNPPLSYIDRTNIGSITILQGVTPVSLGGDSIGGTIVVKSAEPRFAEAGQPLLINGKLSSFYRSNGDAFGGSIAAGVANQNARLDYTGSHTESGNYSDGNGATIKSSAYENQNHAAGLSFKWHNHLVEIKGGQQHIPFQGFPNQRMDLTNNDSIFGNIRHKGQFNWGTLESTAYLENTSHSMNYLPEKLNGPGSIMKMGMMTMKMPPMPMESRGRNLGYKVQVEIPFDNQRDTVRVGNEFHSNRINDFWPPVVGSGSMAPNDYSNLNNAIRDRVGTYAEWEAKWSPEWRSQLGFRYDHTMSDAGNVHSYGGVATMMGLSAGNVLSNSNAAAFNKKEHERHYDLFDISASVRFTPNNSSQYEWGYARKNRAPNLYQLYTWDTWGMAATMLGTFGDGNGYVGNMNVKPETAHNISFTAAYNDAKNSAWEIKATPYFSYVENFIDADRCKLAGCTQPTNGFYYLQYANHDARLWGADVSGRAALFSDKTLGQFSTRTVMSYVRGERMDGGNLYNMMPFNAKLSVDHQLQGWKNAIEMQFVDGKSDLQQVRNELKTSSYVLLNARTGYQWKNLSIDVGLDNVLDKQYYHPLAGAYTGDYYAMSLSGSQANTRTVPGMGRSVFVGMSLTY